MHMPITSFRDLIVWQQGMVLAERVYALSDDFPDRERYGLTRQLRDAVVSIPSNVAEGHARRRRAYGLHVNVALGSEAEVQTQLELAYRLKFVTQTQAQPVLERAAEVGRLLRGLERALNPDPRTP